VLNYRPRDIKKLQDDKETGVAPKEYNPLEDSFLKENSFDLQKAQKKLAELIIEQSKLETFIQNQIKKVVLLNDL
jgi:hypothetical protein